MDELEPRTYLLFGGLILGFAFGVLAQRSSFCFQRMLSDAIGGIYDKSAVLYFSTLSIAIIGTQALLYSVDINLDGVIQLSSNYSSGGIIVGGVIFGIGMTLTRGCPLRHIILAAEGSARSWVVLLLIAITGYATMRGILSLVRVPIQNIGRFNILDETNPIITLPQLLSWNAEYHLAAGLIIGGSITIYALFMAIQKNLLRELFYGSTIGLIIPAAWYVTGNLGYDEFDPIAAEGISFMAPIANTLQFLMTYTGASASFGVTLFAGCLVGANASAVNGKTFIFRSFEHQKDILRYTLGALMLGFGTVLALGCTIGQGLSGLSLLSLSSVIAVIAIILGGFIGTKCIVLFSHKRP